MNGKLARAIRREKKYKATPLDRERLKRQVEHYFLMERSTPKALKVREHKQRPLRPMGNSEWKRMGPLILQHPVYQLKAKIFSTLTLNAEGVLSDLSSMQKALLRTVRTAPKHWVDRLGA